MIFILDNFDSFTYNLYQYFCLLGEEVVVRRRDMCSIEDIQELSPELIVISPGPCAPKDADFTLSAIDFFKGKIPILGVCLGHQAIGSIFGAEVIRAQTPVHGKVSLINHDQQGVFKDIPNPFTVARYHSLALDRKTIPAELLVTAETLDGEIMGIRHIELPIEGVQFHPEAILTEHGHKLLENSIENARLWWKAQQFKTSPWQVKKIACSIPPIRLMEIFRTSPVPFFLDSGRGYSTLGKYSFMGAYPFLQVTAYKDLIELIWPEINKIETIPFEQGKSLAVLDNLLNKYRIKNSTSYPFVGGAVGFFSYDLKDELEKLPNRAKDDLNLPLWRLAWYDGIIVFDHTEEEYSIISCGITESGQCKPEIAEYRIQRLEQMINDFGTKKVTNVKDMSLSIPKKINLTTTKEEYISKLKAVIDYIYAGDTYQVNLTQRFHLPIDDDAWSLYQALNEKNPAPFAAFLPYEDFQILSSSPERFIRINSEGIIETCPIKGTRPRGSSEAEDEVLARELSSSVKDRAELTMIIDLMRNDLGRICEPGSVRVTDLIRLEKYPTVWHLVSTITGKLLDKIKPSDILKAVFPGGSITGAPKIRAMEIIEELEPYKRGVYTGSIGYIGFDGVWDLNIVIRTILLKNSQAYFNGGGGIVADSIPLQEYEETLTKVKALAKVLGGKIDT